MRGGKGRVGAGEEAGGVGVEVTNGKRGRRHGNVLPAYQPLSYLAFVEVVGTHKELYFEIHFALWTDTDADTGTDTGTESNSSFR